MPASLPNEPYSPFTTRRQLPQHPKMRLSYILNPSSPPTQTTVVQPVVPEPVPLPEEPLSDFPSSRCPSDFGDVITTRFVPDLNSDLLGSSLLYPPSPASLTSSPHELPHQSQPRSRSCSPSLLASGDIIPPSNPSDPDLSFDSLRYSLSYNSHNDTPNYHGSRNALGTPSPVNRGATGLSSLPDHPAIYPPSPRHLPLQPLNLNIPLNDSLSHPELLSSDATPSSSESIIIGQPLPQHPKMMLSYILNPSGPIGENPQTTAERVGPNPVPAHTSRSPSPTSSVSEVSSLSTSLFHSNGSPVLTQHPSLDSPPHDESQLSSPTTTPPSSPSPVPQPVPDLPQMVQPPQLLPWEGPPPPGLNPGNHRAYQRAGVHWMLAQIFGPDIG